MNKFSPLPKKINLLTTLAIFACLMQFKGQTKTYIPFYKDVRETVYLHLTDRMTTECFFDFNCDKKLWLKIVRVDKSYSLAHATLKCTEGEIRYDYALRYNSVGKRTYEERKNEIHKITPNTILYELYAIYCDE